MSAESRKILLIGRSFGPGSSFLDHLCREECACTVAHSLEEASAALRSEQFDVVLSEMGLPDGTAFPLIALLEGTPATLYFCVGVHEGCWWLPALAHGRKTWGGAALRPPEFALTLAALLGTQALQSVEAAPAADADRDNFIPMPPIDISPPKPIRVLPDEVKSRKTSA